MSDKPEYEKALARAGQKPADFKKLTPKQQLLRGVLALVIIGVFFGGLYVGLQAWARASEPVPLPAVTLKKNSTDTLLVPLTIDFGRFRRVELREPDAAVGAWTGYKAGGGSEQAWGAKKHRTWRVERAGSGKSLMFGISSQTEPQDGIACAIVVLRADSETDAGEYRIWLTQVDSDSNRQPLPMITVKVE